MARQERFNTHQRLGLGVLVVIGITTLVFGIFHINKAIAEPMARKGGLSFKSAEEVEKERVARLKTQDTDGDGLSDYDELYIFRTSPFLEDTDSDGIPDGVEVAQGTDPNCPTGQSCRQARPAGTADTGDSGSAPPNLSPSEQDVLDAMEMAFGDLQELTPETMRARLAEMTADELREFMRKIGVPNEMLQQTDDDTMRTLLLESLQEIPAPEDGESDTESE